MQPTALSPFPGRALWVLLTLSMVGAGVLLVTTSTEILLQGPPDFGLASDVVLRRVPKALLRGLHDFGLAILRILFANFFRMSGAI
jgi:hypothetical protein